MNRTLIDALKGKMKCGKSICRASTLLDRPRSESINFLSQKNHHRILSYERTLPVSLRWTCGTVDASMVKPWLCNARTAAGLSSKLESAVQRLQADPQDLNLASRQCALPSMNTAY